MELDQIFIICFYFLNLFALFGLFLGNKKKNQFNDKNFIKSAHVKNGRKWIFKYDLYLFSCRRIFYSVLSIGFIGFGNWTLNFIFYLHY